MKGDAITVWLLARDPRTPWFARALAFVVAAYALSPIDLIPDAIPILGLLDDIILVPLGLWAVMHLTPPDLITEARARASVMADRPAGRGAVLVIVTIWIAAAALAAWLVLRGVD